MRNVKIQSLKMKMVLAIAVGGASFASVAVAASVPQISVTAVVGGQSLTASIPAPAVVIGDSFKGAGDGGVVLLLIKKYILGMQGPLLASQIVSSVRYNGPAPLHAISSTIMSFNSAKNHLPVILSTAPTCDINAMFSQLIALTNSRLGPMQFQQFYYVNFKDVASIACPQSPAPTGTLNISVGNEPRAGADLQAFPGMPITATVAPAMHCTSPAANTYQLLGDTIVLAKESCFGITLVPVYDQSHRFITTIGVSFVVVNGAIEQVFLTAANALDPVASVPGGKNPMIFDSSQVFSIPSQKGNVMRASVMYEGYEIDLKFTPN